MTHFNLVASMSHVRKLRPLHYMICWKILFDLHPSQGSPMQSWMTERMRLWWCHHCIMWLVAIKSLTEKIKLIDNCLLLVSCHRANFDFTSAIKRGGCDYTILTTFRSHEFKSPPRITVWFIILFLILLIMSTSNVIGVQFYGNSF